ncbi:ribonucleotide reductase subunit alpha [Zwartia panacis]|uniref:ribonucleotide reductase subunit alpha n=1 Tax=Zwartia panacis TaxID=2683345 RepID=UPI0025B5E687|nr:ribonucleotide reductase subunit alpha [Zwartia panacis]MDN4015667.1 ribonucleotide reductase subunit alpha [Zwartia panacis]
MMEITSFDDLLNAAQSQSTQQQLLLVFTKAEIPDDCSDEQRAGFAAGHGGALMPVACVDKRADEIKSFTELCQEANEFVQDWDIVFAGALGAKPGQNLLDQEIDKKIGIMVESIKIEQISQFATFNRMGHAVKLIN